MIKYFVFLFLIISLFSCTVAGGELGLIGTWQGDGKTIVGKDFTLEMTFNCNDTGSLEWEVTETILMIPVKVSGSDNFKLVKADSIAKTLTLDFDSLDTLDGTYEYTLAGSNCSIVELGQYGTVEFTKQ